MLVCNIGNTNIAMAFFINNVWNTLYRISSKNIRTFDEYKTLLTAMLPYSSLKCCTIVAVSSVVPSLTAVFCSALQSVANCTVHMIHGGLRISLLHSPKELGNDLLANAVASFENSEGKASITADFGTALTLTAVRKTGEVAGVSISPGLDIALQSLVQNATQLSTVTLAMPQTALGTTTESAINVGMMLGYRHLTCGIISEMKEELGEETKLFATGGFVKAIAPACGIFDVIDNYHTLQGIRIIAEQNFVKKGKV